MYAQRWRSESDDLDQQSSDLKPQIVENIQLHTPHDLTASNNNWSKCFFMGFLSHLVSHAVLNWWDADQRFVISAEGLAPLTRKGSHARISRFHTLVWHACRSIVRSYRHSLISKQERRRRIISRARQGLKASLGYAQRTFCGVTEPLLEAHQLPNISLWKST